MWKKEKEEKNGVLLNKYGNKQGEKTVELKKKVSLVLLTTMYNKHPCTEFLFCIFRTDFLSESTTNWHQLRDVILLRSTRAG